MKAPTTTEAKAKAEDLADQFKLDRVLVHELVALLTEFEEAITDMGMSG